MTESGFDSRHKIVFFDGVCHLCNGFVDFAIQNETHPKRLKFAPLQGETAKQILSTQDRESLSTVIFYDQGKILRASDAVLEILKMMKFPWSLLGQAGKIAPLNFRDFLYQIVAKNRYQWFGEKDSCRIPLPHERDQLWP